MRQTYVEVVAPKDVRRRTRWCLIHGAWQTGTNWMGTGTVGRAGPTTSSSRHIVYMIDQPMRGRLPRASGRRPHAHGHAQQEDSSSPPARSPGPGRSQEAHAVARRGENKDARAILCRRLLCDAGRNAQIERRNPTAQPGGGAALLDKIGPAIVLTHSQSGPFGWLIADAGPALKASSPSSPPAAVRGHIIGTGKTRPGPTDIAITYDPPVKDASEIAVGARGRGRWPDLFVLLDAEGAGASS